MKKNKQEMLDVLQTIRPAVSKKAIVEQMDCFLFTGKHVYAYNDKISIGIPLKTDFIVGVPSDELYAVLQKCPGEEIEFELTEDGTLSISSKKFRAGIRVVEGSLMDSLPDKLMDEVEWHKVPEGFVEALNLCSFSAAKDASVVFLNCVSIQKDKIVSSDNYRISKYELKQKMNHEFLLPLSSVIELCKIGGFTEYAIHEVWALFKNKEGVIFNSRMIQSQYPDTSELFAVKGQRFKFPESIVPAIDACGVFADPVMIDSRLTIKIGDQKISCRSENEKGWAEYDLEADSKVDDLQFEINPTFLAAILKHATTVVHGENRLLFRSGAFQHVVALC